MDCSIYTADLKGRDRGEEAFLGKIRHNILHASRKTGEAVKRLSDVRHMPETRSLVPTAPGQARQGRQDRAGMERAAPREAGGPRRTHGLEGERGGEGRGGEGGWARWGADELGGGRYQIPSLPHDAGEATFLIKEKQPL